MLLHNDHNNRTLSEFVLMYIISRTPYRKYPINHDETKRIFTPNIPL